MALQLVACCIFVLFEILSWVCIVALILKALVVVCFSVAMHLNLVYLMFKKCINI
jgi:hypothetical protein